MHKRVQFWPVIGVCLLILATASKPAVACLSDTLDDRAVEWSKLIVVARLSAIRSPQPLVTSTTPPANSTKAPAAPSFQLYDFQISSVLDGPKKPGETITIIRFLTDPAIQKNSVCGQQLTSAQVGKSFLLLLRPESDLRWSDAPKTPDPRPAQIHKLKAFTVVHLESADDLGAEGLADAKYTITSTRQAEAQFNADDAKVQVQTFINAADDTEQDEAKHAIMEMGPKALPVLNQALSSADDAAKPRLEKIIAALSPPAITAATEPH